MCNLKKTFKLLPVLLAICLFSLPAEAKYGGGIGEPNEPYKIAMAEDLILLGESPEDYDKHFILTADIDLDPNLPGRKVFDKAVIAPDIYTIQGFQGIVFNGVFDGNNHTISNFSYTSTDTDYVGLFGYVRGGRICGVGLIDPNIDAATGGDFVGSLVGHIEAGTIAECYVQGGSVSGQNYVGGLVGSNASGSPRVTSFSGTITKCYSTSSVLGNSGIGGLVGSNGATITNSYATGEVSGDTWVGGLVGSNGCSASASGPCGTISNCYSMGSVTGDQAVGGLVGINAWSTGTGRSFHVYRGTITNCYSTGRVSGNLNVGGLVGYNSFYWSPGQVTDSFWDIQTSDQNDMCGNTNIFGLRTVCDDSCGKTTAKMKMASTFTGWWCSSVWKIDDGRDYPRLWWEDKPGEFVLTLSTFLEGSGTQVDPYLIYTAEQLNIIGSVHCDWDKHFKLMADIDLVSHAGTNFNIIGDYDVPFTGVFDGNGHTISHLTYTSTNKDHIGLFGWVEDSNAVIRDLGLIDPNIDAGTGDYVGSLVGLLKDGTINGCYVEGGSVSGEQLVGGLVGGNASLRSRGRIDSCYASTSVYCSGNLSRGRVTTTDSAGGLVGSNYGRITNCYSTGSVTGNGDIGGLVGNNSGDVTGCFWDTETSDLLNMCGSQDDYYGTGCYNSYGKSTAEMQDPNTFRDAGWDFVGQDDGPSDVWAQLDGRGYPILWLQLPESELPSLPKFSGGTGKLDDPYLVSTGSELNSIGHNPRLMRAHFKLIDDIDLAVIDFYIIGNEVLPFSGVFDGSGKKIYNLSYTSKDKDYIGLFGCVRGENAEIKKLGLIDPNNAGPSCVGSLVGYLKDGTITCCYVDYVEGGSVSGYWYVGGLVGRNRGSITTSYSIITVSGEKTVGGLVGLNDANITNCYSTGFVEGTDSVGGLVGVNAGTILSSFWDIETSEMTNMCGIRYDDTSCDNAYGKTTTKMQTASTFLEEGWDFVGETENGTEDIWSICEGTNYPRLVWQITAGDFVCPDGITIDDFVFFIEHWGDETCDLSNDYCQGTDLDQSGTVDAGDLEILVDNWLAGLSD